MAELVGDGVTERDDDPRAGEFATILALRARVAELEALLDARTQAIVGMGARLAATADESPSILTVRVADLERELAELRATKLLRYSAVPRRLYSRLRGLRGS